ncbi:GNAT family N-acetyltransferase [Mesorhizobium sp. CAU 1741]|uniref:GNAT family N-acetyltransferase n=1 Tax=Mesorhizobium sp. CAU 1741 TaxID=3140366 RepID=UPI00325A720A
MPRTDVMIRVATPGDLDPLERLIAASYAMLDDGSYDPQVLGKAMPAIARANPALLASGSYFVAEIDGEAAGCGGWTRQKPGSGDIIDGVAHIRHFATHPAHLRKGVARALLDHCLNEAAAAGIMLMKSQSTLPAEPFYASAGFRRIRPIEVETAKGVFIPAVEMERVLA